MGQGGLEDIEKATNDLLQVFIFFPLSFSLCVFHSLTVPRHSPSFPFTLPLMVIYLVGKGFAFSPERSTTGRQQKKKKAKQPQKKKGERRSGHKREKRTENISLVSVSPVTLTLPPTLPHSCNGSEGLATDSEGKEKRITCQYLFPLAAWIETDTLHSLSLFPPKPIQELYLCLGSTGLQGVAWEKADMAR